MNIDELEVGSLYDFCFGIKNNKFYKNKIGLYLGTSKSKSGVIFYIFLIQGKIESLHYWYDNLDQLENMKKLS